MTSSTTTFDVTASRDETILLTSRFKKWYSGWLMLLFLGSNKSQGLSDILNILTCQPQILFHWMLLLSSKQKNQ